MKNMKLKNTLLLLNNFKEEVDKIMEDRNREAHKKSTLFVERRKRGRRVSRERRIIKVK